MMAQTVSDFLRSSVPLSAGTLKKILVIRVFTNELSYYYWASINSAQNKDSSSSNSEIHLKAQPRKWKGRGDEEPSEGSSRPSDVGLVFMTTRRKFRSCYTSSERGH